MLVPACSIILRAPHGLLKDKPAAQFSKMHIELNVKHEVVRLVPPCLRQAGFRPARPSSCVVADYGADANAMKAGGQESVLAKIINNKIPSVG